MLKCLYFKIEFFFVYATCQLFLRTLFQLVLSNTFCNDPVFFSEGWEQSGLFEFYKAKLKYIKDREEAEKLKVQEFPPSRSR